MYPIGAVLEIQNFFYKHVSAYLGRGLVLQNHPVRGEEIVSLHKFSNGKKITMRSGAVRNKKLFLQRVNVIAANPKPYDVLNNNCEHTVHKAINGKPKSPQLSFAYFLIGIGIFSMVLSKNR